MSYPLPQQCRSSAGAHETQRFATIVYMSPKVSLISRSISLSHYRCDRYW
jgi:hypothetical protein